MSKNRYISIRRYKKDLDRLLKKVQRREKYSKILCIKRGGIIIGVFLSYKLNIPLEVIDFSSLEGLTFKERERVLLVDDLIDSGETLSFFLKGLFKYVSDLKLCVDVAVLYRKKNTFSFFNPYLLILNDLYYVDVFPGNTWITFWYEGKRDTLSLQSKEKYCNIQYRFCFNKEVE